MFTPRLRLQFLELLLIIPDYKLISSSVSAQRCSSYFTLAFLQCCLFYLASHRILYKPWHDWSSLRGLQNPRPPLPFLSTAFPAPLTLQAAVGAGQWPGLEETRPEGCPPASEAWTKTASILTSQTVGLVTVYAEEHRNNAKWHAHSC